MSDEITQHLMLPITVRRLYGGNLYQACYRAQGRAEEGPHFYAALGHSAEEAREALRQQIKLQLQRAGRRWYGWNSAKDTCIIGYFNRWWNADVVPAGDDVGESMIVGRADRTMIEAMAESRRLFAWLEEVEEHRLATPALEPEQGETKDPTPSG